MHNFIFALIILFTLLVFTVVNCFLICDICDEITDLINQGDIDAAFELWENKEKYINLFVRDAEVDKVEIEFLNAKSGDNNLLRLKNAVSELKNSEIPLFNNIL